MSVAAIPPKMNKACKLYLSRNYEEADKIMSKNPEPAHQKAAIEAQLALFSQDFDKAAERCMEFLPYITEWYSGNMLEAGIAMITFCGMRTGKERVSRFLEELKSSFVRSDNERNNEMILHKIENAADILKGCGNNFRKEYTPPEKPLTLAEEIEKLKKNKKDISPDAPKDMAYILSRTSKSMDCNEFTGCVERFSDCREISQYTRLDAVSMYLYMGMPDKIPKAVRDFYRYSWIPVEKTIVMPISLLAYDVRLWDIFDEETFDYIYKTPNILFEK